MGDTAFMSDTASASEAASTSATRATRQPSARAVERAFESIRGQIVDGTLLPGDRLPGIGDLCAQVGVSHSSIREAVSMLTALGVLESVRGSGTYVSQLGPEQVMGSLSVTLELLDLNHFLELYELRRIVEAHVTGQAAAHADAALDERLLTLARAMEATTDATTLNRLDNQFHTAIYRAGGNASLAALLDVVKSKSRGFEIYDLPDAAEIRTLTQASHRLILRAIAARDPDAANAAAAAHVLQTEAWLRDYASLLSQHKAAVHDSD